MCCPIGKLVLEPPSKSKFFLLKYPVYTVLKVSLCKSTCPDRLSS